MTPTVAPLRLVRDQDTPPPPAEPAMMSLALALLREGLTPERIARIPGLARCAPAMEWVAEYDPALTGAVP